MKKLYVATSIVLMAMLLLRELVPARTVPRWPQNKAHGVPVERGEAKIALGGKIRLPEATLSDLESIPELPAPIAERLFRDKSAILKSACALPREQRYHALEHVRGIGPKTAARLKGRITFESLTEGNLCQELKQRADRTDQQTRVTVAPHQPSIPSKRKKAKKLALHGDVR